MVKNKTFVKIVCGFLAVLMLLGSVSVLASAVEVGKNYKISQTPTKYKYIKYWGSDGSIATPNERGWETFYKRTVVETGEPAYCLEFGKEFNNGVYTDAKSLEETEAWSKASNKAKAGVQLASIYGYPNCYSEYGDAAYYATQIIIWEYMLGYRTNAKGDIYDGIAKENGPYDVNNKAYRFILSMQTKGYSDIETAYRGILNMMNNHTNKPSFSDTVIKLDYNPQTHTYSKTLVDTKGIFNEFDLASVENGISVVKNGNTITVSSNTFIDAPKVNGDTYIGGKTVTLNKRHTFGEGGLALYATGNPSLQTLICGTIPDPQTTRVIFYTDNGHLKVTKQSEDGNVSNIKFNIRCDEIGFNEDYITNADGKIELQGLPVGYNYTIKEYTPDQYIPTKEKTVPVRENETPNVYFNNSLKRGSVTVNKTDASTGKALSGAEFVICKGTTWDWDKLVWNDDLINADGTIGNDYFVTDENGVFTANNLLPGDYILMEDEAPDGYKTNSTEYPFTIVDGNTNISFDITNERNVNVDVEIDKRDENGSKLGGAEISVYEANSSFEITNTKPVFVGKTSAEGNLKIDGLGFKNYVVKETKAPHGYKLPTDNIIAKMSIVAGTSATDYTVNFVDTADYVETNGNVIKVTNSPIKVAIYKFNKETNEKLKGATFEVKSSDDDKYTLTTGEDGMAVFERLKANTTYTYREISAPEGYYCDKNIYSFTTDKYGEIFNESGEPVNIENGLPVISVANTKTKFVIKKVDGNDNPLANAEFDIFNKERVLICHKVTDENGLIILEGYPEGDYYAVETKAPDGYAKTQQREDELSFTISLNTEKTLTVHNHSTFITIKKVKVIENGEDIRALKGAEFMVYNTETGEPIRSEPYVTDEQGLVTISNLLVNTRYYFVETKAPDGFYTDNTKHHFIIDEYGIVTDGNGNQITEITNHESGDTTYKNEFVVKNKRTSFTIRKVDSVTNEVITTGAKFEIYKADENGNFVKSEALKVKDVVTGNDGTYTIHDLPEGTYFAAEKIAPTGYVPNFIPIKFTIGYGIEQSMNIENEKTSVVLKKVDANDNEITISDVEFDLYMKGTSTDTKVNENPLKTDENGKIEVTGLEINKEYYFVETSTPKGYYTNTDKYGFKINGEGKATNLNGEIIDKLIVENEPTSFVIRKVDADTGNVIEGVVFAIYSKDGTYIGSYTTDSEGKIYLNKFTEGMYYAEEVVFPTGYIQDGSHHEFIINRLTKDETLTITNKKTSVTLSKVDLVNGEPVEGATIEIYNENNECVYSGISDANGTITVDYLPVGTYTFKETINPDGYQINTETYSFTINADGTITNGYAITNAPTEVIITKTDADGNLLKGATIAVYNADGEEIYRGVTNELGQIKLQYLKSGTYTYKEIAAPDGYKLNKETFEFTVNRDGSVEGENVMINESTSVTITKTDENNVPLSGSTIAIFDENGEEVFRDVTNEFGKISVSGLHYGKYTYKEIECPDGYVLDDTVYEFTIDTEGNVIGDNVIVNIETSVVITKTNKEGQPIENATIGIYTEDDELLFTLVTDKDGKICVRNLLSGKYYFKEILPAEGYEINAEKHNFEITREGKVIGENTLENSLTKVVIKKTDKDGKALSGATIGIYNENDELVASGKTDENGEFVVNGLKPGSYYAKEIEAPKGYLLSDEKTAFTIDEYGVAKGEFTITNEPVPVIVELPKTGSSITKKAFDVATIMFGTSVFGVALAMKKKKEYQD